MLGALRVESIEELLALSDIVSLHCPLSKETIGLVDRHFLNSMKKGASLVNTARAGRLEDTDSIYDALQSGQLDQCALDVLVNEPPKDEKLITVWRNQEDFLHGRLLINPHTSYYSQEAYKEIRTNAAKNAFRLYNGDRPYNLLT